MRSTATGWSASSTHSCTTGTMPPPAAARRTPPRRRVRAHRPRLFGPSRPRYCRCMSHHVPPWLAALPLLWSAAVPRARRPGVGPPHGARPGGARHRAAHRRARRHRAQGLQRARPRLRLLPRADRRRAVEAAAPHQGGPARAASLLEGAGAEQAAHHRLAQPDGPADRHLLPPRPPRHRAQQLPRPHPARRGRRGARRAASARAERPGALRVRAQGLAHDPPPRPRHPGLRGGGPAARLQRPAHRRLDVPRRAVGDLVRMAFQFTRPAYLDDQLEDITVAIENSLWEGRYWLPYRQEIAIRRRLTWLDFPVRGIIRGAGRSTRYRLNQGVDPRPFATPGPEIVAAPPAVRDTFRWTDLAGRAIRTSEAPRPPGLRRDPGAGGGGGRGARPRRSAPDAGSAAGRCPSSRITTGSKDSPWGWVPPFRCANDASELRLHGGVATATSLPTGRRRVSRRAERWTWRLDGARAMRDLGDLPVISGVMNSLLAEEAGADYDATTTWPPAGKDATLALGGRTTPRRHHRVRADRFAAHARRLGRGAFSRPNLAGGRGGVGHVQVSVRRLPRLFATVSDFSGKVRGRGGPRPVDLPPRLRRPALAGRRLAPGGGGARPAPARPPMTCRRIAHSSWGVAAPCWGEGFRAYAGRASAWGSLDLRLPVAVPELPLGSFAGTGPHAHRDTVRGRRVGRGDSEPPALGAPSRGCAARAGPAAWSGSTT